MVLLKVSFMSTVELDESNLFRKLFLILLLNNFQQINHIENLLLIPYSLYIIGTLISVKKFNFLCESSSFRHS